MPTIVIYCIHTYIIVTFNGLQTAIEMVTNFVKKSLFFIRHSTRNICNLSGRKIGKIRQLLTVFLVVVVTRLEVFSSLNNGLSSMRPRQTKDKIINDV
jgi:hypothetical protein